MRWPTHAAANERDRHLPTLMDDMGLWSSRHAPHAHQPAREEDGTFFQVTGKMLGEVQEVSLAAQYRKDCARMHRRFTAS